MLQLDQLKEIVLKNLKKDNKFLEHIRGQLKMQTFKIIDQESKSLKDSAGFQWEHPQISKLKNMDYGSTCLEMIFEFLDFFKLEYTLEVFKKEVAISKVQRKSLENEINFRKTPDSSKPVFLNILTDYIHILDNGLIALNSPKMNQSDYNINNFSQSYTNEIKFLQKYCKYKEKDSVEEENKSYDQSYDKYDVKQNNWTNEDKDDMLDRIEREENERKQKEEEEREKQRLEKLKKEQEELEAQKSNKKKGKLQAPPVEEKKLPPTAVNVIRGGSSKNMNAASSIYNIGGFGSSQQQQKDPFTTTGKYGFNMNESNDPYGFDLDGDLKSNKDPYAFDMDEGDSKDPYAFDITEGGFGGGFGSKNNKKTNQYNFGLDEDKNSKKKKDDPKKNKFAGSSGLGDPYSYDMDDGYGAGSYKSKNQKQSKLQNDESNEYLDEDIDDFQESNRDTYNNKNKKDNKNPMFTSSEDVVGASQSYGFDQSVQSDVMDNFDYFEPIQKKKR